jgi:hypothetical protein
MTSHPTVRIQALLLGLLLAFTLTPPVARASASKGTARPAGLLGTLVVACTGGSTLTYNPGLKNAPQDITFSSTVRLSTCVDLLGRPLFTSAKNQSTRLLQGLSCADLAQPFSPTEATYTWSDGGFSKVSLVQTRAEAQGATTNLISTGTVTEGRYERPRHPDADLRQRGRVTGVSVRTGADAHRGSGDARPGAAELRGAS